MSIVFALYLITTPITLYSVHMPYFI